MSVAATSWAWEQMPFIGRVQTRLVLLALADHADPAGECYPGRERIARMVGSTPRSVSRQVATLEDLGLLERIPRHRPNGSQTSTLYRLKCQGGDDVLTKGGLSAVSSPEPSVEPSLEPKESATVVAVLFEYWKKKLEKAPNTRLTPERRKKLRERLKHYEPDQIRKAIDGCAGSAWHREHAPSAVELALICRSDTKLEEFIERAPKNGTPRAFGAEQDARADKALRKQGLPVE